MQIPSFTTSQPLLSLHFTSVICNPASSLDVPAFPARCAPSLSSAPLDLLCRGVFPRHLQGPPQAQSEFLWPGCCVCMPQMGATLHGLQEGLCMRPEKYHLHSIQFNCKNDSAEKQPLAINAVMNYAANHKHHPQILCLQEMALCS